MRQHLLRIFILLRCACNPCECGATPMLVLVQTRTHTRDQRFARHDFRVRTVRTQRTHAARVHPHEKRSRVRGGCARSVRAVAPRVQNLTKCTHTLNCVVPNQHNSYYVWYIRSAGAPAPIPVLHTHKSGVARVCVACSRRARARACVHDCQLRTR